MSSLTRPSELRELSDDDRDHRLKDRRQELFNLRFQSVTGALENSARLKLVKREIARILTVITEREMTKAKASKTRQTKRRQRQLKRLPSRRPPWPKHLPRRRPLPPRRRP